MAARFATLTWVTKRAAKDVDSSSYQIFSAWGRLLEEQKSVADSSPSSPSSSAATAAAAAELFRFL